MVVMSIGLVLGACAAAPAVSSTPSAAEDSTPGVSGLAGAADGLCAAMAALPDTAAAKRDFVNQAHDALHALAADSRLERALSARVLEAMDRVEQDFDTAAAEPILGADLSSLRAAAADALGTLRIASATCAP